MGSFASACNGLRPLLLTASRLILGVVFFWHGLSKFRGGMDGVEAMFTGMEIPLPGISAWVVAIIEVVGGLALIAGLGTRIAALLLSLVMVGALVFVKAELGITGGANTDLGLLAGLLFVLGFGPGPISVDSALSLEPDPAAVAVA